MNIRIFQVNLFQENATVVWKDGPQCVIIDPGCYTKDESRAFFSFIDSNGLRPEAVLLTHGHPDHVFSVKACQDRYGCPVYLSSEDQKVLENGMEVSRGLGLRTPDCSFRYTDIKDGELIKAAGLTFKVIRTPGHTPGGSCFLEEDERAIFTGDTLFAGTIGRTDLLYGDYDSEIVSVMEKLIVLDSDIEIWPGHGKTSTIGRERTGNPFLEPFNESEEAVDPDTLEPLSIHG